MTLKKGKEQDGMMLAKVKEQDGIMLANVKVPSIPTSAACCDNVQLTIAESSSYTITSSDCVLQTQLPAAYLQLSTTSSDCVLLNTDTSSYLQPSSTSSDTAYMVKRLQQRFLCPFCSTLTDLWQLSSEWTPTRAGLRHQG